MFAFITVAMVSVSLVALVIGLVGGSIVVIVSKNSPPRPHYDRRGKHKGRRRP